MSSTILEAEKKLMEGNPSLPPRLPWIGWTLIVSALVALIVCALVVVAMLRPVAHLEHYGLAPHFNFTDQTGKNFSSDDLKGKVWVADFIFTRCPGPCPLMTMHMAELYRTLGSNPGVALVTFTVDPTYDTPAVLKEYSERVGASPQNWKFLTGSEDQIKQVVTKGFLQMLEKNPSGVPMHSTRFVLVDKDGVMRGFPDGNEPGIAQRLSGDIQRLLHE